MSRLLSGTRGASEVDVAAFLAVCGTTGDERERLLALSRDQHTPSWFQQHGSRLPQQLRTLMDHENEAVAISEYQSMVLPGVLQTGEYTRAVLTRSATVPADE